MLEIFVDIETEAVDWEPDDWEDEVLDEIVMMGPWIFSILAQCSLIRPLVSQVRLLGYE